MSHTLSCYFHKRFFFQSTTPVYLTNRSAAYHRIESYGLSLADAEAALKLNPNYAKAYYRKGCALLVLQRYKEAKIAFTSCAKLSPNDKAAREKLQLTTKIIKEEAFAKAIAVDIILPSITARYFI